MRRWCFLSIMCIVGILPMSSMAATRLGLHVTQEELNCWKQRSGTVAPNSLTPNCTVKYKTAGDVSSDSPGDWDRIVANKNSLNSSAEIWTGYTGAGCAVEDTTISPLSQAVNLRDAAFYALVANDATVANQVRLILLDQVSRAGTDFSNTSKWCVAAGQRLGARQPAFIAAEWGARLLHAYDYVKGFISAPDRQTIDTWFLNAGTYFRLNSMDFVETNYGNESNFLSGTLSGQGIPNSTTCGDASSGYTHLGGNPICWLGDWHNNRVGHMMVFAGEVGVFLNNSTLKNFTTAWVKSWIKYAVYPDTTLSEMGRGWQDPDAAAGWYYPFGTYDDIIRFVDEMARNGDLSLYQYSTTDGAGPTQGGPKTIKTPATFFLNTSEGTAFYYKWGGTAITANLIDPVYYSEGGYYTYEVWLSQPNLYWQDAAITTAYFHPGPVNKYGATIIRAPEYGWTGSGQAFPGRLFMFGQMEGVVSPFSLYNPLPPTNLQCAGFSQTRIDCTWTAPTQNTHGDPLTNLAGFKIYRCNENPCTPTFLASTSVVPPQQMIYNDSAVSSGHIYLYYVTAVDSFNAESAASITDTAEVIGLTLPSVKHFRWYTPGKAENGERLTMLEDQNIRMKFNGAARLRVSIANQTGNSVSTITALQCHKYDPQTSTWGSYQELTNNCALFGICIGTSDVGGPAHNSNTTQLLTPTPTLTFQAGAFVAGDISAGWPQRTLLNGRETEFEFYIVSYGLQEGVLAECQPIQTNDAAYLSYPSPLPKATMRLGMQAVR